MTLTLIDKKSTLAKLLATENIEVQQNKVRTASFDVKNRVLTIPIFKHENKDVIDMLIAHECSHALWTGLDDWKSITEESDEYKAYCNVLEDCRIDRMIQKKYPGIVKNYINGYKELIRIDFFGVNGKDFNTLNLIDRINLYYKSSKTADISFADAEWVLDEIDNLKSLDDVKVLARKLLEQEKAKQESTSDDHSQDKLIMMILKIIQIIQKKVSQVMMTMMLKILMTVMIIQMTMLTFSNQKKILNQKMTVKSKVQ